VRFGGGETAHGNTQFNKFSTGRKLRGVAEECLFVPFDCGGRLTQLSEGVGKQDLRIRVLGRERRVAIQESDCFRGAFSIKALFSLFQQDAGGAADLDLMEQECADAEYGDHHHGNQEKSNMYCAHGLVLGPDRDQQVDLMDVNVFKNNRQIA
jgi:hypothetical protein